MNITILTIGTRGDVQPFVALGTRLTGAGHEVALATGRGFEAFVTEHGLHHASLDVDLLERLQSSEGRAAISGRNLFSTVKQVASMYRKVLDQEWAASQRAGALVYHPKALGGYHIAEALGIPGFLAHPVPMLSPTRAFPNPVLLPFGDLGGFFNALSYGAFLRLITAPYHRTINRWRKQTLGLPPRRFLASELELHGRPIRRLVCCSPRVLPPPGDWDRSTSVTGYWFLDRQKDWQPPAHLSSFLEAGEQPVYVGFGSLAGRKPERVAAALMALEKSGQRGVLATERGSLPPGVPESVCAIESAPHEWLFPRMTAVVHHGGAGTTAEGLRAGKPTIICPTSLNDQAFWGRRVVELGVGPKHIPQKKLAADDLARAVRTVTSDDGMRRRAEKLGEKIRAERGVARAVEIIEEQLEVPNSAR
jgi:sterol 3beta-glucosyltransferase